MSPESHCPLLKPLSCGSICSLPVPNGSSQIWEGEIHLIQRRQAFIANVHYSLAGKVIEEAEKFLLSLSVCVLAVFQVSSATGSHVYPQYVQVSSAWLSVYPHQVTMKK